MSRNHRGSEVLVLDGQELEFEEQDPARRRTSEEWPKAEGINR